MPFVLNAEFMVCINVCEGITVEVRARIHDIMFQVLTKDRFVFVQI